MNKFLIDLIKRFLSDTPWFFKGVQIISVAVALVMGLPALFESSGLCDLYGPACQFTDTVYVWAAALSALIAQLAVNEEDKVGKDIK